MTADVNGAPATGSGSVAPGHETASGVTAGAAAGRHGGSVLEGSPRPTTTGTTVHRRARPAGAARSQAAAETEAVINRARLYLTRLDPWSAVKVGFMLALAIAVMIIVAVAVSWWALSATGVFEALARNLDDIIGSGTTTFDLRALLAFDRIMGVTLVLAALEVLLVSALAGLLATFYNLTVGVTGGVEVELSDDY